MATRCIAACVGKIRLQGWIDDPQSPVYHLVKVAKVALPLYPQFGTEPNVYYIPPRWAPRGYLRQMFGPGVDHAIEQYSKPDHELLGVLQLFGSTQRLVYSYKVEKDEVIGMEIAEAKATLLTVTDQGFGKRTRLDQYRTQGRGGKGHLL